MVPAPADVRRRCRRHPRSGAPRRLVGHRGYVALEYEADEDALSAIPGHLAELRRLIG